MESIRSTLHSHRQIEAGLYHFGVGKGNLHEADGACRLYEFSTWLFVPILTKRRAIQALRFTHKMQQRSIKRVTYSEIALPIGTMRNSFI